MTHSKLHIGQTITASAEIINQVLSKGFKSDNLNIGHLVQYTHDTYFESFEKVCRYSLFDRKINGICHDDKCATWYDDNKKLSTTHTISPEELKFWELELAVGNDVIIHSFEQVQNSVVDFIYRGALSFKLLKEFNFIQHGTASGKPIFYRNPAYKKCLIM